MNERQALWIIRSIPASELRQALALVSAGAPGSPDQDLGLEALEAYAESSSVVHAHHVGAYSRDLLLAACLRFDHPGKAGVVFVPALEGRPHLNPVIVDLLEDQSRDADRCGLTLVQSILQIGQEETARAFSQASYEYLANLVYMECPAQSAGAPSKHTGLVWSSYGPDTEEAFLDTIEQTYQESLDCPTLAGRRKIEDIMEGHRGSGHFTPGRWLLLSDEAGPVGVMLMSKGPDQVNAEIVYMGVSPRARGNGYGKTLLGKANQVALQTGADFLSVAVDAANAPAMHMYRSFGFEIRTERQAWVRFGPAACSRRASPRRS